VVQGKNWQLGRIWKKPSQTRIRDAQEDRNEATRKLRTIKEGNRSNTPLQDFFLKPFTTDYLTVGQYIEV